MGTLLGVIAFCIMLPIKAVAALVGLIIGSIFATGGLVLIAMVGVYFLMRWGGWIKHTK